MVSEVALRYQAIEFEGGMLMWIFLRKELED